MKKVEKIIVVRHGLSGTDGQLTPGGIEQMRRVAEMLAGYLGLQKTLVLASSAPRGSKSGDIIAMRLGCPSEHHEMLWSDARHLPRYDAAIELLRSRAGLAEVLVVVTHLEYAQVLPCRIGQRFLGGIEFPQSEIDNGQFWVIDLHEQTCTFHNVPART